MALRIFNELARRSKEWQAVADVALAQQMGGNWFEAFETWQRAYRSAPPDARRSLRTPILNAATRLQLFTRGLDFLERRAPPKETRNCSMKPVRMRSSMGWRMTGARASEAHSDIVG